jgi:predicted nucleotide-binding protein
MNPELPDWLKSTPFPEKALGAGDALSQACSFAFALFTPDDEVTNSGQTYSQARSNVFYETGWFIGRLGRPRVILLLKSGAKIRSNLEGVSRIEFANKVEEKFIDIRNELMAAKIIA